MTTRKHNLCIDGLNYFHRARAGAKDLGDWGILFQFLRSLRFDVENVKPDNIYIVLEGCPRQRKEISSEYKQNRVIDPVKDEKRYEQMKEFHRQVDETIKFIQDFLPVTLLRHPDYEADDTIYNLIKNDQDSDWTLYSTDTDFIQMLQTLENVKLYNPVRKCFVSPPEYDYVVWKSLRGDMCDNIPGFYGIGDKKAAKLALDPRALKSLLESSNEAEELYRNNLSLIRFHEFSDNDIEGIVSHRAILGENYQQDLMKKFTDLGFNSMVKEKPFKKFVDTFAKMM